LSGPFSDKIGRKYPIILSDIFYIIGALLMMISNSFYTCSFGRFVVGLGIGISGKKMYLLKINILKINN